MFVNSDALEEFKQMTPSIRVQKNPNVSHLFQELKSEILKDSVSWSLQLWHFKLFFFSFGFRGIAAERLSWCGTDGSDK